MPRARLLLAVIPAALVAGCTLGPEYQRPAAELPAAWQGAAPAGLRATGERWWTLYGDPALERLVEEALAHNQDLALAVARVDEARALARVADSQRMPAVDAAFDRDRSRRSERTSMPFPPGTPIESNNYRAQLNVTYEVDLWGRLRSASDAARADLLASEAARETVRIALVNETVRGYFALLALDAQVAATGRSLGLRSEVLKLQRVRANAGLINDFNLRQLEAEVAAAQAQLPALEGNRTAAEAALAVLAGRSPRGVMEGAIARRAGEGEPQPPVVPEGLPSDLLLRRPDVVQAEQQLIAANARIQEARAALFPRIGLTGLLGSESAALGELFSGPARIWTLAFALAQPIFQGGRLFAEVEVVKARERQALAQYQKSLQEAFREVRTALSTQQRAREVYDAETARGIALTDALRLARIRYQNGLISQLDVIDAERNLLDSDLNRADALRAQRAAVADLVKALGGGWQGFEPSRGASFTAPPAGEGSTGGGGGGKPVARRQ
ncbi:MAG: efflux transporter outer membrane subunit [Burkholderiales bacterium]|nr:efflux transporter outer membrane subunit [Burkholderiales bacterium]